MLSIYGDEPLSDSDLLTVKKLKKDNLELNKILERKEEEILREVSQAMQHEKDKCKSLKTQLQDP